MSDDIDRIIDFIEGSTDLIFETWQAKALRAILSSPDEPEGWKFVLPEVETRSKIPANPRDLLTEGEHYELTNGLKDIADIRRRGEAGSGGLQMP